MPHIMRHLHAAWAAPSNKGAMYRTLIASPYIASYPALLVLAMIAAWWLPPRLAKRAGMAARHVDNLGLIVPLTSLFGAPLFSWIFYFPPGFSFWRAMTMTSGGLVFYGGLIFGIGSVLMYAAVMRLPRRDLFDVFSAPVALGLAIGRIGCFMAGCCWGDICAARQELTLRDSQMLSQVQTFPALSGPKFLLRVSFPKGTGAFEQHQELGLTSADAESSL